MQDINIEAMIDEIEFARCICWGDPIPMNPEEGIHFRRLYPILAKYIPNFEKFINDNEPTNTTPDTRILASPLTEAF